ncbi:MAG: gliding motility-associated C-terminal domain-containing protein [Bacteroidota bacterium]
MKALVLSLFCLLFLPGYGLVTIDNTAVSIPGKPAGEDCGNATPFSSFPVAQTVIVDNEDGHYFDCLSDMTYFLNSRTFSFRVPVTGCYDISGTGIDNLCGLVISENCVNGQSDCINSVYGKGNATNVTMREVLTAGKTYYLTVSKSRYYSLEAFIQIQPTDTIPANCILCTQDTCSTCRYADVESSHFTGWEGFTGTFNDRFSNPGIPANGINSDGEITIVSGNQLDAIGGFPVVNPHKGKYSIRLGDLTVDAKSSTLNYKYEVGADSEFFTYYYAVVMEDPDHTPEEQPGFDIVAFDPNGDTIPCATYSITAGAGIPGFTKSGDYLYKPWSAVAIPVRQYRGKEIKIQFQVRDCVLGGHLGYAYLDIDCNTPGTLVASNCDGNGGTITGPEGFKTYTWNNGEKTKDLVFTADGNYQLTATTHTDCQVQFETQLVLVNPVPIDLGSDIHVCDSLLRIGIDNVPYDSIRWSDDRNTPFITLDKSGSYSLTAYIKGCMTGDTIAVQIDTLPAFSISPEVVSCTNGFPSTILTSDGIDALWHDSTLSPAFWVSGPGVYAAHRTNGLCSFSDSLIIQPIAPLLLGTDLPLCERSTVIIDATKINASRYLWDTGSEDPAIEVDQPRTYSVNVTVPPCTVPYTVSVYPKKSPSISLRSDTAICYFDSLVIGNSCDSCRYIWSSGETTSHIAAKPGQEYQLTVINSGNCRDSAQVLISVEEVCPELYVPNCFTVDEDGINEVFRPVWVEMTINSLEIYDRWGLLISKSQGPDAAWDGTQNSLPCKTDIYHWRIAYNDIRGKTGSRIGNVTLLR